METTVTPTISIDDVIQRMIAEQLKPVISDLADIQDTDVTALVDTVYEKVINDIDGFGRIYDGIKQVAEDTISDGSVTADDVERTVNDAIENYFTYDVDIESMVAVAVEDAELATESDLRDLRDDVERVTEALDNLSDFDGGTIESRLSEIFERLDIIESAIRDFGGTF